MSIAVVVIVGGRTQRYGAISREFMVDTVAEGRIITCDVEGVSQASWPNTLLFICSLVDGFRLSTEETDRPL